MAAPNRGREKKMQTECGTSAIRRYCMLKRVKRGGPGVEMCGDLPVSCERNEERRIGYVRLEQTHAANTYT